VITGKVIGGNASRFAVTGRVEDSTPIDCVQCQYVWGSVSDNELTTPDNGPTTAWGVEIELQKGQFACFGAVEGVLNTKMARAVGLFKGLGGTPARTRTGAHGLGMPQSLCFSVRLRFACFDFAPV
jgi:hypothetical protein